MLCAALAIAGVVACEEKGPVDFPVVGEIALTGESSNFATSSWYPEEQLGVFVTSEGVTQANLLYAPSETCADNSLLLDPNDPSSKYWMFGDAVGNVALTAKGEAAGFKKGTHNIYAYSPYVAEATDETAVPMPDLTNQDNVTFQGQTSNPAYGFVYAVKEVKEHTSAPVDLGKFTCVTYGLNTGTIEFVGEGAVGKKMVKLIVTADKTVAYKNATFNLVEQKINGEPAAAVVNTKLEVAESMAFDMESMSMKAVVGTDGPAMFVIVAPASLDELETMKFNFTAVLDDNSEWSASDVTPGVLNLGTEKMYTFGGKVILSKK